MARTAGPAVRGRRVLRCCARGATLSAPLRTDVRSVVPAGPMARGPSLTSASLSIATPAAVAARLGSP
ncbi:hypothetical protein RR46_10544 [Papilio xuthus]|uniref:Uncharacterized protein n=1 Tax=Papilio xuthus TaxID=66420 RepID=A0A194PKM5_PAPXU|nr:hypothetical protein RR46_10544 [Papilio xuthus]